MYNATNSEYVTMLPHQVCAKHKNMFVQIILSHLWSKVWLQQNKRNQGCPQAVLIHCC